MLKKYFNFTSLTLLTALGLSSIAGWFAIVGLVAIFPAKAQAIIIMGAAIEIGKIVATVWLRKYWARCGIGFKVLLVPMVIVLMMLTSMGTFGFLSGAHSEASASSGDVAAKVSLIDEKIKTQRENTDLARKALAQLDAQVDARLSRGDSEAGAERAVQIRRQQAGERNKLQQEIAAAQAQIASLNEQRAPIAAQLRKVEAEVGPIKYIAALIYGDQTDASVLERAVRWVIIMLVIVFDPLAIALVLAGNSSRKWDSEEQVPVIAVPIEPEAVVVAPAVPPQREYYVAAASTMPDEPTVVLPQEPQREFKLSDHPYLFVNTRFGKSEPVQVLEPILEEVIIEEPVLVELTLAPIEVVVTGSDAELVVSAQPAVELTLEPLEAQQDTTEFRTVDTPLDALDISVDSTASIDSLDISVDSTAEIVTSGITQELVNAVPYVETMPGYVVYEGKQMSVEALRGIRPDLFALKPDTEEVQTGFGTTFPRMSRRGDIFVRIDIMPNRVYKFDGREWIEINKAQSDVYIYDSEYIKFLIQKIDSGEYDVDMLTDREREQISEYLNMVSTMLGQNNSN